MVFGVGWEYELECMRKILKEMWGIGRRYIYIGMEVLNKDEIIIIEEGVLMSGEVFK